MPTSPAKHCLVHTIRVFYFSDTFFSSYCFDEAKVCVCICVCVFVCVASDSSETSEVIIIKLGIVTASDMVMHHVLTILTLTSIRGHTDLNHETNKCSIISETDQAISTTFAVKIVRLNVYTIFSQFDDLALHSRSQLRLKLDKC